MGHKNNKDKPGFTLIEILVIVAIIGILATVILVAWAASAQSKAAINGYKTSMESLRTAAELCAGTGGTINNNAAAGDNVCNPSTDSKYPALPARCGSGPRFYVANPAGNNWIFTTVDASNEEWTCRGCRLICTVEKCAEAQPGTCN